jgi:hypothetical protein
MWACAYAVDEYDLTYGQLADLLGVSRQRASMMVHKGRELPPIVKDGLRHEFDRWEAAPADARAVALLEGHVEDLPRTTRPRKAKR